MKLTPVQQVEGVYVKRDDLYVLAGVNGSKVRVIGKQAQGAAGIVTAGPRAASQLYIAARIAAKLGVPCRCHTAMGATTPHMQDAVDHGAEIIQHKAGYNTVLQARAVADHQTRPGWALVPLWLRHPLTVAGTRLQCANVPQGVKRVVCVAGSGMTLAGILHGLPDVKVVGVRVGADPTKTLDTFGGFGWRSRVQLVDPGTDYKEGLEGVQWGDINLDPGYEAKCAKYLQPGDLFWIAGNRIIT